MTSVPPPAGADQPAATAGVAPGVLPAVGAVDPAPSAAVAVSQQASAGASAGLAPVVAPARPGTSNRPAVIAAAGNAVAAGGSAHQVPAFGDRIAAGGDNATTAGPARVPADGTVVPTSMPAGGLATVTNGTAAGLTVHTDAARSDGAAAHASTAAPAGPEVVSPNVVPSSDQSSTAPTATGPAADPSAGAAATALPEFDGKAVADPAAQSIVDAASSHLTGLMGGGGSAATPQTNGVAPTSVVAGGADPATAAPYAVLADAGTTVGSMGLRIARAMHDGTQTFSIELHPAELGRVDVRLSFHAEGVGVQMTVDRQETYAAFHRDRAALEQQLAQAGINLGSGGLDLRYGAQSRQPLPQQVASTFRAAASADVLPGAAQSYAMSSDSLVDIIA